MGGLGHSRTPLVHWHGLLFYSSQVRAGFCVLTAFMLEERQYVRSSLEFLIAQHNFCGTRILFKVT